MILNRRTFLKASTTALTRQTLAQSIYSAPLSKERPSCEANAVVNDCHSKLNSTQVKNLNKIKNKSQAQEIIALARQANNTVTICGGRHAMGGQQFAHDAFLIDTNQFNKVIEFDQAAGIIEVEGGMQWPELVAYLDKSRWAIRQKPTGADRISIAGCLSSNAHGRGLRLKPFIDDVVSFLLINSAGEEIICSRSDNQELFSLAIGGYGLFGFIASVKLKLAPKVMLERQVNLIDIDDFVETCEQQSANGSIYGDLQCEIDPNSPTFLTRGIFSCYRPTQKSVSNTHSQKALSSIDWAELVLMAHTDKAKAFEKYSRHYLATNGQIYASDSHQLSTYVDDYHQHIDKHTGAKCPGTEMITEIYVPRKDLGNFMRDVQRDFRTNGVNLIYTTIRLIEQDKESFLPWAKQNYACIIFNLHVDHNTSSIEKTACDFRRLIELGITYGGSYYLTYHRYATKEQVLRCYPQFGDFLALKLKYDPQELFQSNWYRHYKAMFGHAKKQHRDSALLLKNHQI